MTLPVVDATSRTRIGVIAPFDLELDPELWRWVGPDVSLFLTRTRFEDGPVDLELAAAVADDEEITRATRSLIAARPGVVAYLCTSGSFVGGLGGEQHLCDVMGRAGAPRGLTTSGALLEALGAIGARRVAIGAPYTDDIGQRLVSFLRAAGHEPMSLVSLGLTADIAAVPGNEVIEMALAADRPEADAIFLSCTNLRTLDVLSEIEARVGKPVLSANGVTMWAALRSIGASASIEASDGALFRTAATASRSDGERHVLVGRT